MAEVKQIITGDSASAQKAYADLARQVAKLEDANQRMASKMDQGMKAGSQGQQAINRFLERGLSTLVSTAAAWVGVGAVVRAVNSDIEENISLMDRSKSAQVKLGEAQAKLILNTWKMPPEQLQGLTEKLKDISRTTGVEPATITTAAADLYATGQGDAKHKGEVLELAAKIGFQDPQQIPTMAVAIERIVKATGKNPQEAASLMLSGGAAAFIADPEKQAEYMGQATSGIMASSSPANRAKAAEQAMEFVAGFTQVVGEDKGRQSRTQSINTAGDMARFFEEGIEINVPGRSRPRHYKPAVDPGFAMDRLKYLQEHPSDEKLFEKYGMKHMEGLFESPMKRILRDPNSPEAKTFREPQSIVEYDADEVQRQIGRLKSGTPQLITSTAEKKSAASRESALAENTAAAHTDVSWKTIDQTLKDTQDFAEMPWGTRWGYRAMTGVQFMAREMGLSQQTPESIAKERLGERESEILRSDTEWVDGERKMRQPSELRGRERVAYDVVHDQLEILAEMKRGREATEKQTAVLEQIRDGNIDKRPSAAGATRSEVGGHKER